MVVSQTPLLCNKKSAFFFSFCHGVIWVRVEVTKSFYITRASLEYPVTVEGQPTRFITACSKGKPITAYLKLLIVKQTQEDLRMFYVN